MENYISTPNFKIFAKLLNFHKCSQTEKILPHPVSPFHAVSIPLIFTPMKHTCRLICRWHQSHIFPAFSSHWLLSLKENNLLIQNVSITKFRSRSEDLIEKVELNDKLRYFINMPGLFEEFGLNYSPSGWDCPLDVSIYSTKAMLLYTGNKLLSITVTRFVVLKGT